MLKPYLRTRRQSSVSSYSAAPTASASSNPPTVRKTCRHIEKLLPAPCAATDSSRDSKLRTGVAVQELKRPGAVPSEGNILPSSTPPATMPALGRDNARKCSVTSEGLHRISSSTKTSTSYLARCQP